MFCPNCGQQSAYETSRFCRQCGFRLDGAAQVLANSGAPLVFTPPVAPANNTPQRKGLKCGVKWMLASLVLFPFCIWFAIEAGDSPFPLLVPLTLFLAGLARAIYARLFEESKPSPMGYQSITPRLDPALGAPRPTPSAVSAPPTNDLHQAPSVTEQTTGLLNRR